MSSATKRRRNKKSNNGWILKWLLLLIPVVWLLASIIFRKDPINLLKDSYHYIVGDQGKISKIASDYLIQIDSLSREVDSLNGVIVANSSRLVPNTAKVRTNNTELNLRAQPTINGDILTKLQDGAIVQIYYIDFEEFVINGQKGNWVKVQYNDIVGFVFSSYLEL